MISFLVSAAFIAGIPASAMRKTVKQEPPVSVAARAASESTGYDLAASENIARAAISNSFLIL